MNNMHDKLIFAYDPQSQEKSFYLQYIAQFSEMPIITVEEFLLLQLYEKNYIPIIYGSGERNLFMIQLALEKKYPFFHIENPVYHKKILPPDVKDPKSTYFRLFYNALYSTRKIDVTFDKKIINLYKKTGHILIFPPSEAMEYIYSDFGWCHRIIRQLRDIIDMPITVREKVLHIKPYVNDTGLHYHFNRQSSYQQVVIDDGKGNKKQKLKHCPNPRMTASNIFSDVFYSYDRDIEDDFAQCQLCIAYNSSLILDAIRRGIPVMVGKHGPLHDSFSLKTTKSHLQKLKIAAADNDIDSVLYGEEFSMMQLAHPQTYVDLYHSLVSNISHNK